jgi:hypothetical protein
MRKVKKNAPRSSITTTTSSSSRRTLLQSRRAISRAILRSARRSTLSGPKRRCSPQSRTSSSP